KGASESRRQTGHKRKRKRRHAAADSSDAAADSSSAEAPAELVDLNEADVDVLQMLPGIGPALAERIVAVRDQSGPFVSTDDLLDVGGMTQSKVDAIAPYITLR
ncbi:MAG: helix-hairpin-helix domain-containing protein, partial [Candidatus Eremiobacteraeota bacterium]|nr:helix-hairpin-helix domain-containing protein [Candidatus Eremiobacteraeota bacterium]